MAVGFTVKNKIMIASLGGAEVSKDGTRNYAGSGGMVGGLSLPNGGWSNFTGAGRAYNRFTPNNALRQADPEIIIIEPTGNPTGGTSGGGYGGSTYVGGSGGYASSGYSSPQSYFNVPNSPYRGLTAITSGGNALIQAINAIFAQYQAGTITLQQAILQANTLSGYLNNSSVFYQAQHGSDASALSNFRAQASSIIGAIMNWVSPTTSVNTTIKTGCGGATDSADCVETTSGTSPTIIEIIKSLTGTSTPRTSLEAAPNLYQFSPDQLGATGGLSNMVKIAILAAVAILAYWLYKKYA